MAALDFEATVAGLRAYADWLEQNGDELLAAFPYMGRAGLHNSFYVDTREELAKILGLFGRVDRLEIDEPLDETERREGRHGITFYRDFGGGVSIYAHGRCCDLCDHVDEPQPVVVRRWVAPPLLQVVA